MVRLKYSHFPGHSSNYSRISKGGTIKCQFATSIALCGHYLYSSVHVLHIKLKSTITFSKSESMLRGKRTVHLAEIRVVEK
jgi:hypothetical protein